MSDQNDLLEIMSDSSVMRFTGFKVPQSHEKVEKLLKKWITEGSEPLGVWAAEDIHDSQFLGWFMLKKTICDDPELGFMLLSRKWGKGYATEVASGFLDYAFNNIDCKRVFASTVFENIPSIKVLIKIGMIETDRIDRKEGIIYFEKVPGS